MSPTALKQTQYITSSGQVLTLPQGMVAGQQVRVLNNYNKVINYRTCINMP